MHKTKPTFILVRHFFFRLFNNDFIAFEDQMKEKTLSFLALTAIFSAHIANTNLMKYMFVPDEGISWVEKCYFISFVMVLMGFITLFEWDVLFPDERDFANLIILPIKLRTIFVSKFIIKNIQPVDIFSPEGKYLYKKAIKIKPGLNMVCMPVLDKGYAYLAIEDEEGEITLNKYEIM